MGYGARLRVVAGVVMNYLDNSEKINKLAKRVKLIGKDAEDDSIVVDECKLMQDGMLLYFCQNNEPSAVLVVGIEIGIDDDNKDFYDWTGNSIQGAVGFDALTLHKLINSNSAAINKAEEYCKNLPTAFSNSKLVSKFGVFVLADIDE